MLVAPLKRAAQMIAVLLVCLSAAVSFANVPQTITRSLRLSAFPDAQARRVAAMVQTRVPLSPKTTLLYLNGVDGGDNFYRVRYLLYPLHFVDYWSWSKPTQGGYVWNAPRFSTSRGIAEILKKDRVRYVIAASHPRLLRILHKPSSGLYLFAVNASALAAGRPLQDVLRQVVRWP